MLQQAGYSHHHPSMQHHHSPHNIISQANYMSMPQPSSYVSVPMNTVIQHHMAQQSAALGHQRCSVSTPTNFYIQTHNPGVPANQSPSCSLAKLQQLTNGLDMIPPACSNVTPPPACSTVTPPPLQGHHVHGTMTPPPTSRQLEIQQQNSRNLTTPPVSNQMSLSTYHKYYQGISSSAVSRSSRGPVPSVHQMQAAGAGVTANVPGLNPNLYSQLNGYRVSAQQGSPVTGYIANSAGFMNQPPQMPVQMMNMNTHQYQDQALQRAQANPMYTTYGYINSGLMQPLNGSMRR